MLEFSPLTEDDVPLVADVSRSRNRTGARGAPSTRPASAVSATSRRTAPSPPDAPRSRRLSVSRASGDGARRVSGVLKTAWAPPDKDVRDPPTASARTPAAPGVPGLTGRRRSGSRYSPRPTPTGRPTRPADSSPTRSGTFARRVSWSRLSVRSCPATERWSPS